MMFKKIPLEHADSILTRYEPSEEALACIDGSMSPDEVIKGLMASDLLSDAVQFMCHALPVREVIWWACIALELRNGDWSGDQLSAITCAKQWVKEPDEARRRLAEQHVTKLGHGNAPGWLVQAVFWNGSGSMSNAGEPVLLPPENIYAAAASGAINMAASMPEWEGAEGYYQKVIAMGLDLANGGSGDIEPVAAKTPSIGRV